MASQTPSPRPRASRALTILLAWLAELAVVFVVAEAVAAFFLPAGLDWWHYPQKMVQPSTTRIYEPVPNQHGFTIDKPYVTNSLGFRDEREVPLDKHGELRILSIGDSIAEGLGVATQDTYARQLETALRHRYAAIRVINAGVSGYMTWQAIDLLKDKGLRVRPDIVILEFYPGDNLTVRPRNVVPWSLRRVGEEDDARIRVFRAFKRSRVLYFLRERLEIIWLRAFPSTSLTRQQMQIDGRTNPYLERVYTELAASFEEFASLSRAHHFVPILIIYPYPEQVARPNAPTYIQGRIEDIARGLGLPAIDLLPPLRRAYAATHDVIIPWDNVHMTPHGHQVVAAALERYLVGSGGLATSDHAPAGAPAGIGR